MKRFLAVLLPLAAAACATIDEPTAGNLAQYCTARNAYLLGSQARAYLGVCPKDTEAQFLQGLARGRAVRGSNPAAQPYYERISQTEQQLLAVSTEAERAPLRERLRDLEWWAIHLLNNPGNYMP